jgi:hypothetical protein
MNGFEKITMDQFDGALEASPLSQVFKDARISLELGDPCYIHSGPLTLLGTFRAPGLCTLILGDLTVDGLVDLQSPEGFDGHGVFIAVGNVTCRSLNNDWAKVAVIDGSLLASDLIINCYEDSMLLVTGNLKTKFFYGRDIWATVGGAADMDYGDGYCLPVGYRAAAAEAIEPRHDTEASMSLLAADGGVGEIEYKLLELLRQGKPVSR